MIPNTHEQWQGLDFPRLLTQSSAFLNTDSQNSILDPEGCLTHERIWDGAREQGGPLYNTLRLAKVCRDAGMPFLWLRYDRFIGEIQPATEMDRVQYSFWNKDYKGDRARKDWEADLVPEVISRSFIPDGASSLAPEWSVGCRSGACVRFSYPGITPIGAWKWRPAIPGTLAICPLWSVTPAAARSRSTISPWSRSTIVTRRS